MSTIKIKQTDQGMSRYYMQRGRNDYFDDGKGKFEEYCEANGFDDEDVADELAAGAQECMLVDFDEDFPFNSNIKNKKQKIKNQFIYNIISTCYNNHNAYNNNISSFTIEKKHFNVPKSSNKMFTDLETNLRKHCSAILKSPEEDKALIHLSYISIINIGQPYLHLVSDLYARDKITYYLKSTKIKHEYIAKNNIKYPHTLSVKIKQLTQVMWVKLSKHCQDIQNFSKSTNECALIQSALTSYYFRISPLLACRSQFRIKENYKHICQYIEAAVDFVFNLANNKFSTTATCPFQYDFCVAHNESEVISNSINIQHEDSDSDDSDDDDDDSDSDDEKKCGNYFDCFGNVKRRLSRAGCIFHAGQDDTKAPGYRFRIQFEKFAKLVETKRKFKQYPQQKRFISLLDRREPSDDNKTNYISENSELIFFEPPSDCFSFPEKKECVDLWYFNSSKTCIIPNLCKECFDSSEICSKKICGYNQENFTSYDAKEQEILTKEKYKAKRKKKGLIKEADAEVDDEKKNKMRVINTEHTMKNGMLLLSFHVQSSDEIRCYLYLSGCMVRFLAEDLNTYLPQFFIQSDENVAYVNSDEIKGLIENIKTKLIDKRFTAFYNTYRLDKGNSNIIEQHITNNIVDESRK